ncbi:phage tail protein [Microvirgula aerodenitrificans]|uniref:phage tail protein n=1 Tax=Microvirgula aerodenitrificans TaxID=57480 RepID=UPI0028E85505|nr:phage tail protein [Microvirgula aerodenitrificans]
MHPPMSTIDTPDGLFHDGNPATGEAGTLVTATHLNAVQSSILDLQAEAVAMLAAAGLQPEPARKDQWLQALTALFLSRDGKARDSAALDGHPASYFAKAGEQSGGLPLLFPLWCPNRATIPAGYAPADGQWLSRGLYPDAWTAISAGNVPITSEAAWLSAASERGKYTAGDGASTFRLPDYNGKSAGSLGAVFMRGDGALSAGADGVIQLDEYRSHTHPGALPPSSATSVLSASIASTRDPRSGTVDNTSTTTGASGGTETRPLNVTGCWVIKLFGAAVNPGAADAAQLATEVAVLRASKAERQDVLGAGYLLVRDEKAKGTDGGASTGGATVTRTLNTVVANTIPGAGLSNNQITLPAGIYRINAWAQAGNVNCHRASFYNVTDSALAIQGMGLNATGSNTGDAISTISHLLGRITLPGPRSFELRHYTEQTLAGTGLGTAVGNGGSEIYASVEIIKEL